MTGVRETAVPERERLPFARVLEGVRVLDFCWVGAGALVTKLLADLGADVIKVESTKRPDNLRTAPPFKDDVEGLERSGYFASRNTSKKSLALNMKHPLAAEVTRDLARKSDIVTNNFRPGVMERWGVGYDRLRTVNPSLVFLSMPMQGADGPHSSYIGFGSTIVALAGLAEPSGLPDRAPVGTGTHYADHVPNPGHALVAVLAALLWREKTGQGQAIELSQLESTVNMVGPALLAESLGCPPPRRRGNRSAGACPHGVFPCAGDDAWCAISVTADDEWTGLVAALGWPAWSDDPDLVTLHGRARREDDLEARVAAETRRWPKWELMRALQGHGVPAAAVATSQDLVEDDPHLQERGFWRHPEHAVLGPMAVNCAPFRVNGEALPPVSAAPLLGTHTRDIVTTLLGYSDGRYDELERSGLFE